MKIKSLEIAAIINIIISLATPTVSQAGEGVDEIVEAGEAEASNQTIAERFPEQGLWTANIKRIGIEYMEHSVTNKEDPNYPDTYNADEESNFGGVFDGNVTFEKESMVWINGLYAIYSKSKTTEDGETSENEKDECFF